MGDLPFLDALQKQHCKALGYFPTKQFEGYIDGGHVLVAVGATLASPGAARAGDEGEWRFGNRPPAAGPEPLGSPVVALHII